MTGRKAWAWACGSARAQVSACVLGMSVGLAIDCLVAGTPPMTLCTDFAALDAAALASRIDFLAHTMPFMHLGAVLGVIASAIVARVTPTRAILNGAAMLAGMALGGALTMGLNPTSEWFGMSAGMVLAEGLTRAGGLITWPRPSLARP